MSNTLIKTHNIFINSSMRVSGSSNDFIINLKNPLILTNKTNFFRLRLNKCIIPHVIKQVNQTNNKLYFNIIRTGVNINSYATITPGNYNILTLLTEVTNQLSLSILASATIKVIFSTSYNKATGYATINMVGVELIQTTLTLLFSQSTTLGLMLGFSNDVSLSFSASNIPTPIISTQNVNVNPMSYITIRSNTLRGRESYENIVQKDVYSDIIAMVTTTTTRVVRL